MTPREIESRVEQFGQRCREAGLSLTHQRLTIYRSLLESVDHPTPEALFARVRPALPSLSLATIYKTLDTLAQLGLVAELPATGSSRRFDGNMERHHHLVCTRCGRVSDYSDPGLDGIAPPSGIKGFTAQHLSIHVHGLCRECAPGRGSH